MVMVLLSFDLLRSRSLWDGVIDLECDAPRVNQ